MSIFSFKVIAVSKKNVDTCFDVGVYRELDEAETVVTNSTKAYTYKDHSSWEFVIQRIY